MVCMIIMTIYSLFIFDNESHTSDRMEAYLVCTNRYTAISKIEGSAFVL